jgi:uncharacterized LabA/DUF88 family protein
MSVEIVKNTLLKPNIAFVDAQNLHFGTTKCHLCAAKLNIEIRNIKLSDCTCGNAWKIDLSKFRIYLKEKYNVSEAYYFLGFLEDNNVELYNQIQKAGFIVVFKEHTKLHKSVKKGNIDTDMVFEIMKNLLDNLNFEKILLVSGDGDYKKIVNYLISKNRFLKMLFPNKKFASSLYKELGSEKFDYLENLKTYIASRNEKGS